METLVVIARHRNQSLASSSHVADPFAFSPSKDFRATNCRTFDSGADVLPLPIPKVSSPNCNPALQSSCFYSEPQKQIHKSKSIPVNHPPSPSPQGAAFIEDASYSELWAGPAYSNSPPPSSLPIPKFSLGQKRSLSMELFVPKQDLLARPASKSAPSSPNRELTSSDNDFPLFTYTATENLRRILRLDIVDDRQN